jgi:hypothetical protein
MYEIYVSSIQLLFLVSRVLVIRITTYFVFQNN